MLKGKLNTTISNRYFKLEIIRREIETIARTARVAGLIRSFPEKSFLLGQRADSAGGLFSGRFERTCDFVACDVDCQLGAALAEASRFYDDCGI